MNRAAGHVETHAPLPTTGRGRGGKFLTFFLSKEEYGIEILKVQEIIGMMDITPIPGTPAYIRGVINLRGKVIPVLDIRLRLSMSTQAHSEKTCIIVVQAHDIEMGVVVDEVSEVADIRSEDIQDAPCFGAEVNTEYVLGIAKSEKKVRLLLNIERVISSEHANELMAAASVI